MNNPKKNKRDRALFDLVAEYESSSKRGQTLYLDEQAYGQLIDYYEEEEQFERALEVAALAIGHYGFSADFYLRKAQILLQTNREEQALDVLHQASTYTPNDLSISLLRAEALTYLQRFSEAIEELARFKPDAEAEDLSDIFLLESLVYEQQEDYNRMFDALKAAIQMDPHNEEALERLWLCTEYSRRYEESRRLHEWIIDQEPYSSLAWYNLGQIQAYLGNYDEAIEAYEYGFLIDPDFEEAYYQFADQCYEIKRYRQALDAYLEILERFDTDGDLLLQIGRCYQYLEQYREARRSFNKALRVDPHLDEALFHLGETYAVQEKWDKALSYFERAAALDEEQEDYLASLADAAFHLGDFERAESYYLQAIELSPQEGRFWMAYVWFLVSRERRDDALATLREADETAAGPDLAFGSVAILMALGCRQEALLRLGDSLGLYFEDRALLFDWMPELQRDPEITAIISLYRP